jgi:glutamate racemase
MPKLVEFAENKDFESEEVRKYIQEQIKEYNLNDYSNLVLGCTHFPFFKNVLSEIFNKDTAIIDGSQGVANRLKYVLEEKELLGNNELSVEYYYSGKIVQNKESLDNLLYM